MNWLLAHGQRLIVFVVLAAIGAVLSYLLYHGFLSQWPTIQEVLGWG